VPAQIGVHLEGGREGGGEGGREGGKEDREDP
jgi:hypothetical protein